MQSLLLKTNHRAFDAILLVLRVVLAVVMFPHGAQKLLGWFGGYGLAGTLQFFTGMMHVPAPLAWLVILVEFFGPILLVAGLASSTSCTRLRSL